MTTKRPWATPRRRRATSDANPGRDRTAKARAASVEVRTARADAHAARLAPTIAKLQASGVTTLRAIAAELNRRGIQTPRGRGEWDATQVRRVLARL
jgi:Recombinase